MPAKPLHLAKVKRTSVALLRAQDARDEAVFAAIEAGYSLREVSKATGYVPPAERKAEESSGGLSVEGVRQVILRLSR
jgi:hypothetical protein